MSLPILMIDLIALGGLVVVGWMLIHVVQQNVRCAQRIEQLEQATALHDSPNRASHGLGAPRRAYGDPISSSPGAPRIGFPAPPFELPDQSGALVNLNNLKGRMTFVLFWDPSCSHCKHIIDDLRTSELVAGINTLQVLIVSTGPESMHEQFGLTAPVLLDNQSETRMAFGAVGTPSAVLIDEHGNIASTLARGGPSVLALLKRAPSVRPRSPLLSQTT